MKGVSYLTGLILMIIIAVIFSILITNPSIVSKLKGAPKVMLEVHAVHYKNTNESKLTIIHKGGEPLDLKDVAIFLYSKDLKRKLEVKFGSGFRSLVGYYYKLNRSATNPNSHNPEDIVFSEFVFSRVENQISYRWGAGGPNGLKNYFGVEWIGEIVVDEGDYTFYLTSDDGSWLWIDDNLIIDNGGLHSERTVSKSVHLSGGVHRIRVKMFEWAGAATCILQWSGKDMPMQVVSKVKKVQKDVLTVSDSVTFDVKGNLSDVVKVKVIHVPSEKVIVIRDVVVEKKEREFLSGLKAYYYTDESWTNLKTVRVEEKIWYADSTSGFSSEIPNWPEPIINKTDSFSVKWEGYLYVPSDGDYTFYLTSDDGSWLYIDGNLIIDNGGLHSPLEMSATIHLDRGFHRMELKFFEHYGGAVIRLEWERFTQQQPQKEFLNAAWRAYYYEDEGWKNLVNVTNHNRIRFADAWSGWSSDIQNWPEPIIGETDTFSVNFSADIYMDEGDYTFYLTSDDGSWLYIDGQIVIDNGGLHSPREVGGSVHLSEGNHKFEVKMFEHYGGAVIYLKYAKGQFGRSPVTSLYHAK